MKLPQLLKTFLLLLMIALSSSINAQNDHSIPYQFFLRNHKGDLVKNTTVNLEIIVYQQDVASGPVIYAETHTINVPGNGLVQVEIGKGNSNHKISDVIWKLDESYFVKAVVHNVDKTDYVFEYSSPLIFYIPQIFAGSINNLADRQYDEKNAILKVLTQKDNKLYLSNGDVVELPEYLKNINSILIQAETKDVSCYDARDGSVDVSVSGGVPPYEYYWSNGKTTEDLNELEAGTYTLSVTDKEGYTAFKRVEVFQPEPLEVDFKVWDVTDIGKTDGIINLDISGGNPPYDYLWSNGNFTKDQKGLRPGVYKVTITSSTGCAKEEKFLIREPVEVEFNKENVKCYGGNSGSVRLNLKGGRPPYEIRWSNKRTGYYQDGLTAGKYYVFIKDSWGFTVLDSVNILQPYPLRAKPLVKNLKSEKPKGSVDLHMAGGFPPYSYRWSTMDTTRKIDKLHDGVYSVTVSDQNSCQLEKKNIFVYRMIEDKRDTMNYKVITIGNQVWIAENINHGQQIESGKKAEKNGVVEKYCYKDNPDNCDILGGLYTWEEMMQYNKSDDSEIGIVQGVCPDGWHIPTSHEWKILADYLGGEMVAANRMKNFDYWTPPGDNTEINLNLSGFSAYPAGRMDITGDSYYLGKNTSFWSASRDNMQKAWYRTVTTRGSGLYRNSGHIEYRFSVRCVKDVE
jgi:uncharacterized protein (TIGR02145 family)